MIFGVMSLGFTLEVKNKTKTKTKPQLTGLIGDHLQQKRKSKEMSRMKDRESERKYRRKAKSQKIQGVI